MNLQEINLEDILDSYYYRHSYCGGLHGLTPVSTGLRLRAGSSHNGVLERLLRHHTMGVDDWNEIAFRVETDQLLTCYSILEIASLTGFVPVWSGSAFADEAERVLADEHVRRYYEVYYPMWLVMLFRRRLCKGRSLVLSAQGSEQATPLFLALLDLDRRFRKQLDGGALLMLLDSFHFGPISFADVVDLIGVPEEFLTRVTSGDAKIEINAATRPNLSSDQILTQAAQQLGHFLQFSLDLRELLHRSAHLPLLQSQIWCYYGYWFRIIGVALRSNLDAALAKFLEWEPRGMMSNDAPEVRGYIETARRVLAELTSPEWGARVQMELADYARVTASAETGVLNVTDQNIDQAQPRVRH